MKLEGTVKVLCNQCYPSWFSITASTTSPPLKKRKLTCFTCSWEVWGALWKLFGRRWRMCWRYLWDMSGSFLELCGQLRALFSFAVFAFNSKSICIQPLCSKYSFWAEIECLYISRKEAFSIVAMTNREPFIKQWIEQIDKSIWASGVQFQNELFR